MIKVVNIISLIIAPIIVRYHGLSLGMVVVVGLLLAGLWWAISRSKHEVEILEEPATAVGLIH